MDEMILPDASWRQREGLDHLVQVLGADAGMIRFVGGAVRDTLLGIDVNDVDLATRHPPETTLDLLRAARIKAVPTGIAHGTITAVLADGPVEVTTLRRDVSTDGRHAVVAFSDDWREDAARRDFTINALYADPRTGEVVDYFDGLRDLADRRVRFIGEPLQRIAEDHLRILRFFRFHARFGAEVPDAASLSACVERANDLMALSRERIADELLKLLVAPRAVDTLALMVDHGVLRPVLPEITEVGVAALRRLVEREAQSGVTADPVRRLSALLPADAAIGETIGARLKLSIARRKRLAQAGLRAEGAPRVLAYRLGLENAVDALLLGSQPIEDVTALQNWEVPKLPVGGGMLVTRGLSKGPDVARLLKRIEDQWIAEGFPDAARANAIADTLVAQALGAASNA